MRQGVICMLIAALVLQLAGGVVAGGAEPLAMTTQETIRTVAVSGVPTALMRFLELTREKGHICSELRGLELCYAFSASASGEGSLTPTWLVVTDTGEFYINALTGREEVLA